MSEASTRVRAARRPSVLPPRPAPARRAAKPSRTACTESGPVFFLPGFQARVFTRSCTIPAHTPVLYTFQSLFNDYPCPDPSFKAFDDAITNMVVTIDGKSIDPDPYRYLTHLFTFTGDPSLTAFDSCVTGTQQVAVVDGWFVILRLSPGDHTLVTTYVNPGGHPTSATFLLHVLGEGDD